jgi:hypothetical protein
MFVRVTYIYLHYLQNVTTIFFENCPYHSPDCYISLSGPGAWRDIQVNRAASNFADQANNKKAYYRLIHHDAMLLRIATTKRMIMIYSF